jgi:NAD+ diphosphatase
MAVLEADPRARAVVIGGELVCLRKGEPPDRVDPTFTFTQADAMAQDGRALRERVFLGRRDEAPLFAVGIDQDHAEALKSHDDLLVADLRSIATQGLVSTTYLPPLAQAKAVLGWHGRNRFCARCGAPTRPVEAGWRRDCPVCGAEHFPRTDPVVIMLVVDEERCLLGRQSRFPKGQWSCLAGFVEPGETLEEAVRRETHEETGIRCGHVAYFGSQPWPFPMSLMIGCHVQALSRDIVVDRGELEDAGWFERDEVAAMMVRRHPGGLFVPHPFAIAHHIIRAWLENEGSLV